MHAPWQVFSLLKLKNLIFCISKIGIIVAVPCALQRWNKILHGSHLTHAPKKNPKMLLLVGVAACGCFVTDVKPMETPMDHLKIIRSQQANQFGKHLKKRGKNNKKGLRNTCHPFNYVISRTISRGCIICQQRDWRFASIHREFLLLPFSPLQNEQVQELCQDACTRTVLT